MHTVYYSGTLGLVLDTIQHIGFDLDILTKVSSIDDAESLVLTSLATILFESFFLSKVG